MKESDANNTIFRIQKGILYVVMLVLIAAVAVGFRNERIAYYLGYTAVVLLIAAAPIRIIAVAGYFKRLGNSRYRSLSYIIIVIIILTALIRALI